ncbi:DUF3971 domain-containing protein [Neorickettsia sennetsu]|uniref:Uncharacterized protein n=1 Tax=Ehrlichia sennetsu (strain ATCC VR-367 / Miyayama) TaxID=222891 RepID=Q2GEM0_EHRS3|nr:AsmA-like C-terminal domain-containing protein [Neorickettsia sennetsu]ABD46291.1 hypothetical protein NSE_0181 [Neorickettsia sennetsu str. Miyayama]
MKFKIFVLLFLIAILSPFLLYKYNRNLSKKFVEYYINGRFHRFNPGLSISFTDFELEKSNDSKKLVLSGIVATFNSEKVALIREVSLLFSWSFPFTKLYPISATVHDADLYVQIGAQKKNVSIPESAQIDSVFSLIGLLNTDLFVKGLRFNGHKINEGFMRIKKMNHKKILQVGIHEENAEIELEIVQSKYDTVAMRVKNLNPNNSVFSPLIRELANLQISDDNFTFSGHALLNLNEKKISGAVNDLRGSIKRNGTSFNFDHGRFVVTGKSSIIELDDVAINIDGTQFNGTILFSDGISLQGTVSNLSSKDVLKYWSSQSAAREWFKNSIKHGSIKEATIKLESKTKNFEIRDASFVNTAVEIDVSYDTNETKRLINLERFAGTLNLIGGSLYIKADSGVVEGLSCQKCEAIIDTAKTKLSGTLTGKLSELILLGEKASPNSIDEIEKVTNLKGLNGNSNADVVLHIPHTYEEQISTKLHVEADNLQADKFYRDFSIISGTGQLEMNDDTVKIDASLLSADGEISVKLDRDFHTQVTDFIFEGTSSVETIKNSGFLPSFLPFSGKIRGRVAVQLLQDGNLDLEGRLSMQDVHEEVFQLFGWEKDPDATFNFRIDSVGEQYNFKKLDLTGKFLELRLSGSIDTKETIINSQVVNINDSSLEFKFNYSLEGDTSNLIINSETLDVSNAKTFSRVLNFGGPGKTKTNLEVNIGTLKLKNALSLSDLKLDLKNGDGNLSGIFNDGTILGASFSKYGGVIVDSTNIGTLLKSLGIKSGIMGGRASFYLGTKDTRSNNGILVVENFYMQDAPILARILSLSSLYGITNILNGEGIFFERFFSQFKYADGIFYISESWLEAAPVGLSIMGILSLKQDEAIIHGSVVPLYKLNKLISKVPIIGTLVTAGKNRGIIAAEYTLTRKMNKSTVSVNTLTTFTPTILHKFFKVFN